MALPLRLVLMVGSPATMRKPWEDVSVCGMGPCARSLLCGSAYWFEDGRLLVPTAEGSHIVHGKTASLVHESAVQLAVRHLRDALEGAILGGPEVDGSCPIVAEVFNHPAGGAPGLLGRINRIGVHLEMLLATGSTQSYLISHTVILKESPPTI